MDRIKDMTPEPVWNLAGLIGMGFLIWKAIELVSFIYRHFVKSLFEPSDKIFATYGKKDSWAVITGGSDGIGLGMAHNLAL